MLCDLLKPYKKHQKAINQKQKILKDLRPSLKCDKKIDYGELSVSLECQNSSKNGCATIEELEGKLKSVQNGILLLKNKKK